MSKDFNLQANLSEKLHFLINCCKTNPSEKDIEFIHSYLNAQHLEINALINLANQHGILPLVYKSIKNLSQIDDSNSEILTELKAHYMSISQRNMLMSAELIRIIRLFKDNGIEVLAFKGPVLAQLAYDDITLRQYGDLDLLIHKQNKQQVEQILLSQGYTPLLSLTSVQEKAWYTHAKDISYTHLKKQIHIEIHWLLLANDYPIAFDPQIIWENQKTISFKGEKVRIFGTEDLLVYLCIHGSKHLWERISWVKDIDLMIRRQTIDWDKINLTLEENHFDKMVYLGLYLSFKLFATPLPYLIHQKIETQNELPVLLQFIFLNWHETQNMFAETKAMLMLFPILKMKLQYLFKIIVQPSHGEYQFINLPKYFHWGYYLVRPYLLIKKYLLNH